MTLELDGDVFLDDSLPVDVVMDSPESVQDHPRILDPPQSLKYPQKVVRDPLQPLKFTALNQINVPRTPSPIKQLVGRVRSQPPKKAQTSKSGSSSSSGGTSGEGHSKPTNYSIPREKRYPQALIIGVRKGGTRALINMLRSHPDIVTAVEEMHFYDRDENFRKGVKWYVDNMPLSTENQITIEKSPYYFVSPETPKRIHDLSPDIKIILIARNPIDRAVSDYNQLIRKQHKSNHGSFEDYVFDKLTGSINTECSPISTSCYDVHFRRWLKYFNRSQFHIVDGDALITSPASEVKKVESFLGVKSHFSDEMFYFNSTKGFYCWYSTDRRGNTVSNCLGSHKGHVMPELSVETVKKLTTFFRPHNERFFLQIGRKFNWDTKYRDTVYT